ncbi:MAG: translocation/assembly module TamB domain-containing protein, partial [Bacteroidia bacterium]
MAEYGQYLKDFDFKKHRSKFSATIESVFLNGYNFRNIVTDGKIDQKIFEGKLDMNDPNGKLSFSGMVDMHSEMKKLKFTASLKQVDLQAMNLIHSKKTVSAGLDFDFYYKDIDNNHGTITATDVNVDADSTRNSLKKLTVFSKIDGNNEQVRIKSEFFNAELKGDMAIASFTDNINNILNSLLPNYFHKIKTKDDEEFTFKINVSNSEWLSSVFYPDLRCYELAVEGNVSSSANEITLNAVAPLVMYKNISVNNFGFKSKMKQGESGSILLGMDNLYYKDSAVMKDFLMDTKIGKNELTNRIRIRDSSGIVHGDILTGLNFYTGWMNLSFQNSAVTFRRRLFHIDDKSVITYSDSSLKLIGMRITEGGSEFSFNGIDNFKDSYHLITDLKNVDVGLLNSIFPSFHIAFGGSLNGNAVLKGTDKKNMLTAELRMKDFSLDKDTLGDFLLSSEYNESQQRVLVYTKSLNGKLKNFEGGGYLSTSGDKQISLNLMLNESDVNFLEAFMKEEVHLYSGTVSAKCSLTGTFDQPKFGGQVELDKMDIGIRFLKTRLKFHTKFDFDNQTIRIPKFSLADDRGQVASVSGEINHKSFSGFNLDVRVDNLNHFHVFNTTVKDNETFYGNAYASGSVSFTGDLDDIAINANLTTEKGTMVFIPLSGSGSSEENGFINFLDRDTASQLIVKQSTTLSGYELNFVINATPDAEFQLIMNEQTGDVIKAK